MNINIEKNPFSSRGAYLAIQKSPVVYGDGIWLRSLIRPEWGTSRKKISDQILRFIPTDSNGVFISYKTICTPECLRFESNFGYIEIFFPTIASIDIKTKNMGLVLEHDSDESRLVNIEVSEKKAKGYLPITFFDLTIEMDKGNMSYDEKLKRFFITCDERAHFTISAWHRFLAFPENVEVMTKEKIRKDYEAFKAYYKPQCEMEELAVYILWSGEYHKCGNLTRNVTAISKSLMSNIWSWDNCFIAMALTKSNKKLARDNIMIFFDLQAEDGRLIDAVNPFIKVDWFTKPPIYGYFILKLMKDEGIFDRETLIDLYPKMIKLAGWWDRNLGVKGLYSYKHPFDSGWDNATCFDRGMPVYSPDLNSYMVLMFRCIAEMAKKLGKKEAESFYMLKSENILNNMLRYMYDGKQFLCLDSNEEPFETASLIKMMPIMLADNLPSDVFESLAQEISKENHFLTEGSLATESVTSRYYDKRKGESNKPNAYWRGPVWAPPTYCIFDGLLNAGYNKLAQKIANRYISLIESDSRGIYENYDAIQKTGYDDSGYLWTTAVYLIFKEFSRR